MHRVFDIKSTFGFFFLTPKVKILVHVSESLEKVKREKIEI